MIFRIDLPVFLGFKAGILASHYENRRVPLKIVVNTHRIRKSITVFFLIRMQIHVCLQVGSGFHSMFLNKVFLFCFENNFDSSMTVKIIPIYHIKNVNYNTPA